MRTQPIDCPTTDPSATLPRRLLSRAIQGG
jgi:hypothetical protein